MLLILGKLTLHSHLFPSLLKGFGIHLDHNLKENILKVLTLINTSFLHLITEFSLSYQVSLYILA
jgi:hypothetical protein